MDFELTDAQWAVVPAKTDLDAGSSEIRRIVIANEVFGALG